MLIRWPDPWKFKSTYPFSKVHGLTHHHFPERVHYPQRTIRISVKTLSKLVIFASMPFGGINSCMSLPHSSPYLHSPEQSFS